MIFKLFLCSVLRLPAERAQGGADLLPAVAHALQSGHRAAAALLLAELAGKAALDQAVQRVLRRGGGVLRLLRGQLAADAAAQQLLPDARRGKALAGQLFREPAGVVRVVDEAELLHAAGSLAGGLAPHGARKLVLQLAL